jgi:endonuclease YncB( thermonuclease family)
MVVDGQMVPRTSNLRVWSSNLSERAIIGAVEFVRSSVAYERQAMRGKLVLALIGIAAVLYIVSLFRPEYEETNLKGQARVIDGDTLEIAGRRIRIFGIDAPEQDQTCERGGGGTWYCGAEATRLLNRIARSQIIECRVRATDIYGRLVARCSVGDEDLGRAMVRSGFAISSSRNREYASEENDARAGRLGIWSGDWRDAHRDGARP